MPVALRELPEVRVALDRLELSTVFDGTPERPYAFIYHITIHNESEEIVTLKGRKWVVRDTRDEVSIHEGDGVAGEFPRLAPGESFHYSSYHLVSGSSSAEGAYLASGERGEGFLIRIPRFMMEVPGAVQVRA
ncbi:ApaG domain [Verrucomicrobium sp. GAS474]|uniref:ApaG domain-containing protein n=1 Tax=Verrucomicrobium sp. GAS474 TaxID=1882831 RepID=UPI0012FFACC0|nr:ApaG domain [Verrucomicrobium sp. GAS474]